MRYITLAPHERAALLESEPAGTGGFQGLLRKLIRQLDEVTNRIQLDVTDLERIPRYAFAYGNGGWENQLLEVFGRHLGPKLNEN